MIGASLNNPGFLGSLETLCTQDIDQYGKHKLNLFMISSNANEFDYANFTKGLLESVSGYAISRIVKERYVNEKRYMELSQKAREKFRDYVTNMGELGELILFSFLEEHLHAPKILTKLELKTSTSNYVNGSDGVHFLRLPNGSFQLIFGESKTIKGLTTAISDAFRSIDEFRRGMNSDGKAKSGIRYEKSLISDNLCKEFSQEEAAFIEKLIYPQKDDNFEVDDAFGIFVGYEMQIAQEEAQFPSAQFRDHIRRKIRGEVQNVTQHILAKIGEYSLAGYNFYIYILPFTSLEENRKSILQGVLK